MANKVLEVGNGVVRVAHQEGLRLAAVVLVAVSVGQDGRYLAVCMRKQSASCPRRYVGLGASSPPSSFAITSALSSTVTAIELLELPKEIPMTVRSPGAEAGCAAVESAMWKVCVWVWVYVEGKRCVLGPCKWKKGQASGRRSGWWGFSDTDSVSKFFWSGCDNQRLPPPWAYGPHHRPLYKLLFSAQHH